MPTFGRTDTGKWHIVGPNGCRYGRAFGDDGGQQPDETVTATDIVAYEPPAEQGNETGEVFAGSLLSRGGTDTQRLVLPTPIEEGNADLCASCRSILETHQQRRQRVIESLKRTTPYRDVDWHPAESERESLQQCYWCRAHEPSLWVNDSLDSTICPACGRLFNTPLGEPGPDTTPNTDRRPITPTTAVNPIVLGATIPDYDPTALTGSNRPLLTVRAKSKYASLKLSLERTGHAFTPVDVAAFDAIRATYADWVAEDDAHQADVTLRVGDTARSVTIEGVYPADIERVIADCWEVVSDPTYWFRVGWSKHTGLYPRSPNRSIPGDDPITETFPRLRTQSPASSVDTTALEQVTEPGRYERGQRYYDRGAVTEVERVDTLLQATVQGSRPYDVRVTFEERRYTGGRCSCPDDAVPCKHIVAAVLASGDVDSVGGDRSLEEVLDRASAEELRAVLLAVAEDDIRLRRRLYEELGSG